MHRERLVLIGAQRIETIVRFAMRQETGGAVNGFGGQNDDAPAAEQLGSVRDPSFVITHLENGNNLRHPCAIICVIEEKSQAGDELLA